MSARAWVALLLALAALQPGLAQRPADAPQETALSNGLRTVLQQDTGAAFTVVQVLLRGGSRADPPGKAGLAYLTARLCLEVTEPSRLQSLLQMGCTFTLHTAADYSLISLRVRSADLDAALAILGVAISEPLFTDMRIDALKEQMAVAENMVADDPEQQMRARQAVVFLGPAADGAAVFGTEASRRAIRRRDVQEAHRRSIQAGNLLLAVISDLDPAAVRAILERRFGRLPAGTPPATEAVPAAPAPAPAAAPGAVIERRADETLLARSALLPLPDAGAFFAATLLESWLGKGIGGRLWPLRERLHLTYEVEANLQPMRGSLLLHISLRTRRGRAGEAAAALDERLAEIRREGIDEAGLAAARTYAVAEFWQRVESREQRAALWTLLEGIGLSWRLAGEWPARLGAVSADEMNRLLRDGLAPQALAPLRIGPAE